jgi:hypothetical protein
LSGKRVSQKYNSQILATKDFVVPLPNFGSRIQADFRPGHESNDEKKWR